MDIPTLAFSLDPVETVIIVLLVIAAIVAGPKIIELLMAE